MILLEIIVTFYYKTKMHSFVLPELDNNLNQLGVKQIFEIAVYQCNERMFVAIEQSTDRSNYCFEDQLR